MDRSGLDIPTYRRGSKAIWVGSPSYRARHLVITVVAAPLNTYFSVRLKQRVRPRVWPFRLAPSCRFERIDWVSRRARVAQPNPIVSISNDAIPLTHSNGQLEHGARGCHLTQGEMPASGGNPGSRRERKDEAVNGTAAVG